MATARCARRSTRRCSDLASGATTGECIAGSESDVIVFDVSGTIHLTTATALPELTTSVRIDGAGAEITIDGSNEPGTGMCLCHNGASLSNLTITGVDDTAITVEAFPGIRNVEVYANRQGITIGAGWGLSIQDSTIHGNEGTSGSGIYVNEGGYAAIRRSAIYANSSVAEGGGIRMVGATVTVDQSTISGNGGTTGGGIYMESPTADSTLKVYNSTIADNVADEGAGIFREGNLDLRNSTIARNAATTSGGGVITDGTGWTLALKNSAIMGNTANGSASDWANGLPGELAANAVNSQVGLNGKTLGDYFSPVTLADNGGPTRTLKPKLVAGNVLIDGGNATVCASDPIEGKDQRGFGRVNPCDIGAVDVDRTKPSVSGISAVLRKGPTLSGTSTRATVTWNSSDSGSGAERYTIQRRVDGGSWSTLATGVTTKSYDVTLVRTHDYVFRVRAIDHDGNIGSFTTSPVFESALYQQTSSAFVFSSSGWATSTADVFSGGSTRRTTTNSASARFTATGRSFAWITTTGPTRGVAQVYVNGTLIATVDLYSPTTTYRVQAWTRSYAAPVSRTIRIVVHDPERVDLDAVAVIK